ncbi:MAG: iron ABC transporter permease [Anaerolineales bacterium]|nr:iron ABC transporter permease [Anaerolineales bacterium]
MVEKTPAAVLPVSSTDAFLQSSARKRLILLELAILTLLLAVFALHAGAADTSPLQVLRALLQLDTGISNVVIWNIRLPRILAGIAAGAGLAVAGCVMQTSLRNPLASPSTLGISHAAAFGANLAIVFFGAGTIHSSTQDAVLIGNPYLVTLTAFAFSMVAMTLLLLLARLRGFSPESVVLAGVAFGSLFAAGSTLVQYFAEDVQVAAMVFWTFGDLGRVSWQEVAILTVLLTGAFLYFLLHRWDYNALDSGDDSAAGLGVHVEQIRFRSMLAASLVTAVAVSFMGIIGFIGLVAPQIMRRVLGVDHRYLIPASAVTGAALLLFSDTLARTMISPVVLPVGAITSFFGAPMFLFLLAKGYSKR